MCLAHMDFTQLPVVSRRYSEVWRSTMHPPHASKHRLMALERHFWFFIKRKALSEASGRRSEVQGGHTQPLHTSDAPERLFWLPAEASCRFNYPRSLVSMGMGNQEQIPCRHQGPTMYYTCTNHKRYFQPQMAFVSVIRFQRKDSENIHLNFIKQKPCSNCAGNFCLVCKTYI